MVRVITSKDEDLISKQLDAARADFDAAALAAYKRSRYEAPSGCACFMLAKQVTFWASALEMARGEKQKLEQSEE